MLVAYLKAMCENVPLNGHLRGELDKFCDEKLMPGLVDAISAQLRGDLRDEFSRLRTEMEESFRPPASSLLRPSPSNLSVSTGADNTTNEIHKIDKAK